MSSKNSKLAIGALAAKGVLQPHAPKSRAQRRQVKALALRTVRDVIRAARRGELVQPPREGTHSHFLTEVRDRNGKLKYRAERHNLTTDTASGYTNRRDWQSKAMGGGTAPTSSSSGNATATSATSLTNSGATFPTSGQGLSGCMVIAGPNASGTGAVAIGLITSNTGTVLTVDKWYSPTTWGTGTTPNSTASYCIPPGQMPAMWLAVTTDATTPASSDTTLTSELTTNGFSRALATYSHTAAASTYTLQVTYTATGTDTINKEAVFGSAVAATGVMPFESAEPSPPTLVSGDTLTQTVTITI